MDLIVTVPDDRVNFVKKLLRELNLPVKPAAKPKALASSVAKATLKLTPRQQKWVDELKDSLKQVELHQQGKIKLQDAYEFLAELRAGG